MEIVIETTAGSAIKYKYDLGRNIYRVKKLLPLGMVFPYHFGFIPNTVGEDGDPLDAMVISEVGSFTGAHVQCRLIGALMANQKEKGKSMRNDRFFFIPVDSLVFAHIKTITAFGAKHNDQLKEFFVNYNRAENKKFIPVKFASPAQALSLLK